MSGGHAELKLTADDAYKLLVCESHIGKSRVDYQCKEYVFKRRADGTNLINIAYTWEKLLLAARAVAAIENPADICVVSSRPQAQRALLKFAAHTGATPVVGRFIPGSLTNQVQKNFKEPRLIIVSDPRVDQQALKEAFKANVPVIAFTDTDSPLKYVDIAIPCNNAGAQSVGLMWWLLARETLRLKGKILVEKTQFILNGKTIMPDLYFYRDPEEQAKEELAKEPEKVEEEAAPEEIPSVPQEEDSVPQEAAAEPQPQPAIDFSYKPVTDWAAESAAPAYQQQQQPPVYQQQPPVYQQQPPVFQQQQPVYQQQPPLAYQQPPAAPTGTNWPTTEDQGGNDW